MSKSEREIFAAFVLERLDLEDPRGRIPRDAVVALYAEWTRDRDDVPQLGPRAIAQHMRALAFTEVKSSGVWTWLGARKKKERP